MENIIDKLNNVSNSIEIKGKEFIIFEADDYDKILSEKVDSPITEQIWKEFPHYLKVATEKNLVAIIETIILKTVELNKES